MVCRLYLVFHHLCRQKKKYSAALTILYYGRAEERKGAKVRYFVD